LSFICSVGCILFSVEKLKQEVLLDQCCLHLAKWSIRRHISCNKTCRWFSGRGFIKLVWKNGTDYEQTWSSSIYIWDVFFIHFYCLWL